LDGATSLSFIKSFLGLTSLPFSKVLTAFVGYSPLAKLFKETKLLYYNVGISF
jgi:hypothetical protein